MKLTKKGVTAWAVVDSRGHIGSKYKIDIFPSKATAQLVFKGMEGVTFKKVLIYETY